MQPWLTQIAQVNPPLFVEFLLDALHVALNEAVTSNVEHPDPVQKLLYVFQEKTEQGITSLMDALDLSHRPTFRRNYLNPACHPTRITIRRYRTKDTSPQDAQKHCRSVRVPAHFT